MKKTLKTIKQKDKTSKPRAESPAESPAVATGFKYRSATLNFYPKEGNIKDNPKKLEILSFLDTVLDEGKVLGTPIYLVHKDTRV